MKKRIFGMIIILGIVAMAGLFAFLSFDYNVAGIVVSDNQIEKTIKLPVSKIETSDNENIIQIIDSSRNQWDHMPLTYNYDETCKTFPVLRQDSEGKMVGKINEPGIWAKEIEKAVNYISQETNQAIKFVKVDTEKADIFFYCDFTPEMINLEVKPISEPYQLAYEQSYTVKNVLRSSEIHLISTYSCPVKDLPFITIHEIGHSIGLEHNTNPTRHNDIMNPYAQDCQDSKFIKSDLKYLFDVYDQGNIYDL